MKKKLIAAAFALLLLTGCAENPDSDIVVHKDMEKLIGEAQQTDESKAEIEDLQQYEHYGADFENESLHVRVHADADVDIPQSAYLSVMRVKQHSFTDEDIAKFRQALFGDAPLYDESCAQIMTKSEIEKEIQTYRQAMQEGMSGDPQDAQVYADEIQREIDRLQEQYEAAPEKIDRTMYPSTGKLEKVADRIAAAPNDDYWQWQDQLNPDGTVCYMSSADGNAALYVQNNPNYSNALVFSKTPVGSEFISVLGGGHYLGAARNQSGLDDPLLDGGIDPSTKLTPIPGDSAKLTQEAAQKQAENFLKTVGMDGFAFSGGGRYNVWLDMRKRNGTEYRQNCYVLQYFRCFDGAMLDQASGMKFAEGWEGDSFRKQQWPGEMVEFMINDEGIVGFCWNAPLDIVETVVDHAALKSFEEITATFEQMMPITAAESPESGYDMETEINIDRITLTYSRISEKDSFDTGLVIPVWAFHGTRKAERYSDENEYFVQMAINAIDGSVIDASLGY